MTLIKRNETKPLTPAQKRRKKISRQKYMRAVLQLLFFLLTPSLFTGAFAGVKYIFTQIGCSAPIQGVSFVWTLGALCLLTMVFGRFFCGYVCAFGALGDGIYFLSGKIQSKLKKRLPPMPERCQKLLYWLPFCVLGMIVILCAAGLYSSLSGWSPWDVFSMATALNFHMGSYTLGLLLLLTILLGMAWEPRFFCRFLCPMGAVFRLLPIFPWALLHRDPDSCIRGCSACTKACPVRHTLRSCENAADCIRCDGCIGICPKGNITGWPAFRQKHPEVFTILKALIYLICAFFLGCLRFL